jgi:hypothetical protein
MAVELNIACPFCGGDMTIGYDAGEPAVMYYANGDGYPGSPAGIDEIVELCELECAESVFINQDVYNKHLIETVSSKLDGMRDDYPEPDYDGYDD